jgi:hypothetical protein
VTASAITTSGGVGINSADAAAARCRQPART